MPTSECKGWARKHNLPTSERKKWPKKNIHRLQMEKSDKELKKKELQDKISQLLKEKCGQGNTICQFQEEKN